jgi:hypothetical protein
MHTQALPAVRLGNRGWRRPARHLSFRGRSASRPRLRSRPVLLRRAGLVALAVGGTLLLIDAWFDVCTSAPGAEHATALAEAAFAEIPLAIAAWWLAIMLTRQTR